MCRIATRVDARVTPLSVCECTPLARPKRKALLRKEKKMVKVVVKGGTPESCESLCRSCTRGHVISGFRATEEEVFCRIFYIEREIHFPVRECTFYEDKRHASKEAMEEIAWTLGTSTSRPKPNLGFVRAVMARKDEEEPSDEEVETTGRPAEWCGEMKRK